MRLVPEEFHDLHTGDHFSFGNGGSIYDVVDGDYIDYWGNRLVMYKAPDGLHAHLANHDKVWLIVL